MNTLKRKLTAILLTFAMLFSLMPALPQAAEAAGGEMDSRQNEYIKFEYQTPYIDNDNEDLEIKVIDASSKQQLGKTITINNYGRALADPGKENVITVLQPEQYEIESVGFSGGALTDWLNITFDKAIFDLTIAQKQTITIVLRAASEKPNVPEEIVGDSPSRIYRIYDDQVLKMLHFADVAVSEKTEIKSVTPNWVYSFSMDETGLIKANREQDYRHNTFTSDSSFVDEVQPKNIQSLTIEYDNGNGTESKTIPAKDLRFVIGQGDETTFYKIELNNDEIYIVYFVDPGDGLGQTDFQPYAVRFVNAGESLGNDQMPLDPVYGDGSKYKFVCWEISSWNGDGDVLLSTTPINDDMTVFAHKVSTSSIGGTRIRVMNENDVLINRIVELYNAANENQITADQIDIDSVRISITDTEGNETNMNYVGNDWKSGYEYFQILNYTGEGVVDENSPYYTEHVAYDKLDKAYINFELNDKTAGNVMIPICGSTDGIYGELAKQMNAYDETILELRLVEPPEAPTETDLEDDPNDPDDSAILGAGSVKVDCSTNEDHQDGDYALLPDSYKIGNVYWDGSYEDNDGAYFVDITVNDDAYVAKYNESNGTHTLVGEGTQTIILKWTGSAWTRVTDTPVTFEVKCESEESTTPEKPGEGTVEGLLKNAVEVVCDNSEATHEVKEGKTYGLIEDGYTLAEDVTGDADNGYTYTVTIHPGAYVTEYNTDTKVDHDLASADQGNKTITLEWTGIEWQVAEGSIPVTITVHCDSEEPTPTTPEKPDADDLNDLLDVVLNCASNVGHDDRTYEDLLENSYDIGNVTHNGEGAYTVGVTINSDKYIADYSNNVVKVVHEIQDKTQATKIVTLTYDKDQETWTTAESPVKFLIVCEGVDWDISNIEKDLVTEATLGTAKTNGVSDDALKNITVPEDMDDTVIIPEDGSVTLLYAITVRGKVGIDFSVEDPGTTLIKSSANVSVDKNADVATYIGSIPENGTVTFYVSKKFTVDNITENGQLVNSATVAGDDGTTVNPGTEDDPANKDDEAIAGEEEDNRPTPPPYIPGGDDDDNLGDNDGPSGLNTEDHFSYVVGYEDGMVKPQRSITRAEVATIFYRLLEDDVRDDYDTTRNNFSDVTSDSWYNQTVSTLASMGILKGYEDGTFRPNASITRAEFAAIATRFFEETGATYEPGTFTDVTGDEWFAGAIMDAVNLGLIGGYEDGTVRPNNNITRAEACAIVNRTLGRVPDADHLLPADEMTTWPDNPSSAWFYADMQEATNGHEYEWITEDGNKIEEWTDILDKDWNDR